MAEQLILAEVTIDDTGAVLASQRLGGSVDELGTKLNNAGKQTRTAGDELGRLGNHLTSLTGATRILAHHIGVTAIAIGTLGLVKSVLDSTAAFKEFKSALEDFVAVGLKGVDAAQEMDKQFADLAKAAGIKGSIAEIRLEHDKAREALKALQDQGNPSNWRLFLVGIQDVFHFSDAVANSIQAAHDRIQELQPAIDQAKAKSTFIGPSEPEGYGTRAYEEQEKYAAELLKKEQELEAFRQKAARANFERNKQFFEVGSFDPFKAGSVLDPSKLDEERSKLLVLRQSLAGAFDSTGLIMYKNALDDVDQKLNDLSDTGQQGSATMLTLANSLAKLAPRLGDAAAGFAEGRLSAKKFLHDAMADLSRFAFTRSLTYLAASLGATTGVGAVIEGGTPHQLRMTALKWAAVGAAAGVGARALGDTGAGGGGGGGARGAGRLSASAERGTPGRVTNLVVNIDGNVVGNEAWLRGAIVEMQRQVNDGTNGGGNFV